MIKARLSALFFGFTVAALAATPGSALLDAARADLAKRLRVPLEEVRIVEQVEKTWGDSSLGCPQPGMQYRQVLIDGSLLILEVKEQRFHYHSGGSRAYFLCPKLDVAPVPIVPVDEL